MPIYDLPLAQLRQYQPEFEEPSDLDAFWSATLDDARNVSREPTFTNIDTELTQISTYDVQFSGFAGDRISGWLHLPAGVDGPLPTVVQFIGYNGGRGLPHQWTLWALAGYAHFVMDNRGQGSGTCPGDTPDSFGSGPSVPGFMTRGIDDPAHYFYRRLIADAVRAVDAVSGHPMVDPARIAVAGTSQGGGMAIAVAGLVNNVAAVMPDVPFLSHMRRGAEVAQRDPYPEIVRYLASHRKQEALTFRTLAYFDAIGFARRATAPAIFSVAMMDTICPPSTVFAAYNMYGGPKEIRIYEFNDHEGGGAHHDVEQLVWLRSHLRA